MDLAGTHYSSPNATNGTPDAVTYKFHLNNNNITVNGTNDFTKNAQGTIDRRVLTLDLAQKTGIDKIYDANANLVDTNTRSMTETRSSSIRHRITMTNLSMTTRAAMSSMRRGRPTTTSLYGHRTAQRSTTAQR